MSDEKIKILVLPVAPESLRPLQVEKEAEEIANKIWDTEHRHRFELVFERRVKRSRFINLLHKHRPHVVHFAGHGDEGTIFLVSEDNKHAPISAEALRTIFAEFSDSVHVVFLNACYTRPDAEAIAEVIDCSLGTQAGISDRAAIAFSSCFYNTLAYGGTIGQAFNLGNAQLLTEQLTAEGDVKLVAKLGVDPYRIQLAGAPSSASDGESKVAPEIETDLTGRLYLSYAPPRISEMLLVASALRDRGIPICEEALTEDRQFTDDAIIELLRSPGTSSGLISLTSDARQSRSVSSIELPAMLERIGHSNGFFVVVAGFSNLDLSRAAASLPSKDVSLLRLPNEGVSPTNAPKIAALVLEQRIAAIHKRLDPSEPFRIELYTRVRPPFKPRTALLMNWTERFRSRYATQEDWNQYLLPALRDVVEAIETYAPGRDIHADGRLSLPAAVALGSGLLQPKNINVRWVQHTAGRRDELWSIDATRESCQLTIKSSACQPSGRDLAVLVSVTNNAEPAFESTLPELPSLRAIIRAQTPAFGTDVIASAGQAADAAFKIRDTIKAATNAHPGMGCVHLFMAVPAGLALMVGQLFNAPVKVQTYDLLATEAGTRYRAAALINPYG